MSHPVPSTPRHPAPAPPLRSRRPVLTAAAALPAIAAWPVASRAQSRHPYGILGQAAPAIEIAHWIDGNGAPTRIAASELSGKWIFMKCFQSWCPGCHKVGFPTLKQVANAFAGEPRVATIAVQTVFEGFSINTRERLREMQQRYDLAIPFAHDTGDPNGDHRPYTMRAFRTGGTPWMVIIEPGGSVVFNDYHVNGEKFIDHLRRTLG